MRWKELREIHPFLPERPGKTWKIKFYSAIHYRANIDPTAVIQGRCMIDFCADIDKDAYIGFDTSIGPSTYVGHDALIGTGVRVGSNVCLRPGVCIGSMTRIEDSVELLAGVRIPSKSHIKNTRDVLLLGPIGSREALLTITREKKIKTGCFEGTVDEFLEAVRLTHGRNKYAVEYRRAIRFAAEHFGWKKRN